MKSDKGFTLIEVLIAKSVLITLLATFIPIFTIITFEQNILHTRLLVTSSLHDELQFFEKKSDKTNFYTKTINQHTITFTLTENVDYSKGCAKWINVQKRQEETCLYGNDEK